MFDESLNIDNRVYILWIYLHQYKIICHGTSIVVEMQSVELKMSQRKDNKACKADARLLHSAQLSSPNNILGLEAFSAYDKPVHDVAILKALIGNIHIDNTVQFSYNFCSKVLAYNTFLLCNFLLCFLCIRQCSQKTLG